MGEAPRILSPEEMERAMGFPSEARHAAIQVGCWWVVGGNCVREPYDRLHCRKLHSWGPPTSSLSRTALMGPTGIFTIEKPRSWPHQHLRCGNYIHGPRRHVRCRELQPWAPPASSLAETTVMGPTGIFAVGNYSHGPHRHLRFGNYSHGPHRHLRCRKLQSWPPQGVFVVPSCTHGPHRRLRCPELHSWAPQGIFVVGNYSHGPHRRLHCPELHSWAPQASSLSRTTLMGPAGIFAVGNNSHGPRNRHRCPELHSRPPQASSLS